MKIILFIVFGLLMCGCSCRQGISENVSTADDGTVWSDDVIPICIWSWTF